MTRRDFELIADALKCGLADINGPDYQDEEARGALYALRLLALDLAERLHGVNPRFDRECFMRACGFGEG